MNDVLVRTWLGFQCQSIPGISRGMVAFADEGGQRLEVKTTWPQEDAATPAMTTGARMALAKSMPVVRPGNRTSDAKSNRTLVIAQPLLVNDQLIGAVSVEMSDEGESQRNSAVQLLQWGAGWLDFLLGTEQSKASSRVSTVVGVVATALEHDRFANAAIATVTELARVFDCERVSLGLYRGGRVHLEAISHNSRFKRKNDLVQALESVMEEAVDQGTTITLPVPDGIPAALVNRNHAKFAEMHGEPALCTVLLTHHRKVLGVLTFERPAETGFDRDSVELAGAMAALLTPTLDLKRKQDRWLSSRSFDALVGFMKRLLGPRHLVTKLTSITLVTLIVTLFFATGTYRVTADASIEGRSQRVVVAPLSGFIQVAKARAGDLVSEGQVLASLDDRQTRLQHVKWTAKRDQLRKEHREALASHDRSRAAILKATADQAEAELKLVEAELERMVMVAPFAGVVVSGDLSQSIGAPVEQGEVLFEIAPLGDYRVALMVSERDISELEEGSRGHLALTGLPGERLPIVVERLTLVSEVDDGRNRFRVEARLEAELTGLRPGMQGIGKVEVGRRRLLWLWTHELLERLRLWTWSWWP